MPEDKVPEDKMPENEKPDKMPEDKMPDNPYPNPHLKPHPNGCWLSSVSLFLSGRGLFNPRYYTVNSIV